MILVKISVITLIICFTLPVSFIVVRYGPGSFVTKVLRRKEIPHTDTLLNVHNRHYTRLPFTYSTLNTS